MASIAGPARRPPLPQVSDSARRLRRPVQLSPCLRWLIGRVTRGSGSCVAVFLSQCACVSVWLTSFHACAHVGTVRPSSFPCTVYGVPFALSGEVATASPEFSTYWLIYVILQMNTGHGVFKV